MTLVNISGGGKRGMFERQNQLFGNRKNKNITDLYGGIQHFKKVYQSRNNLVKNENVSPCTFAWCIE
jgi:hypothetical protein